MLVVLIVHSVGTGLPDYSGGDRFCIFEQFLQVLVTGNAVVDIAIDYQC